MLLADKIVCLTREFKEQIKAKIKFFYRHKKVLVIPNGIDLDLYKPKNNSAADVFYIGMQSRIVSIKDHTTLLKAFALIKKSGKIPPGHTIKLKIAGDGDFKEQLIKLTNELEINNDVEFTGMLNEESLVQFLQSLHLYVHASLGETMSTAIMQAMACGLPIIASDVNGINNMIENGRTGILVPVKNEQLMAEALLLCIDNPVLRQSLTANALQFSKDNFSSQAMLTAYKEQAFIN
jgi:glycosyltransferase involved in cell wall biosynthesis